MATIYADASGNLLAFLKNALELQTEYPGGAPAAASFTITFDETTNAALVADILASYLTYTAPGGVLKKNNQTVTITPASALTTSEQAILNQFPVLGFNQAITILQAGSATLPQTQLMLAYVMLVLREKAIL